MQQSTDKFSGLPQFPESYWLDSTTLPKYPKLTNDVKTEVAIIGGGITGITTAYLLAKKGISVAILEASTLANGTTGHTTAKVTAQHDVIYNEIIQHMGIEKAKQYYQANMEALSFIRKTVEENQIECDFATEDAYLYATSSQGTTKLQDEWDAYQKLGINGEFVDKIPLAIPVKAALVMKEQGRFHPLQYVKHMVEFIDRAGVKIFEQTTVTGVEMNDHPVVITRDGYKVTCQQVVSCSHYPIYNNGFYFAKLHADRSYVLAVRTKQSYPGGMYLSVDEPKRSIRNVTMNGEPLILIGGEGHKTGQGINTMKHYEALQAFARSLFGEAEIANRWSAQDLITLDKLPYIGRVNEANPTLYVATGFRKWGMTSSTIAARLISDLILEKENPFKELFNPSRFYADPSIGTLIKENANVAKHLIAGKLESISKTPEEVGVDEGAVIRINGKRAGAYRDLDGKLHVVDTTCTHMGCEVEWNEGDRSWDCPCHGSRFSCKGEVMEGPAEKSLKKVEGYE
ncbi:FAD-dependent oxidoreductase [Brevibacillus daliensis]|uniref:FAD-dependent oxidoreductase n=1 Tax=Brevibacillus daliensis TaxID=2892995 RepID=UPI001E390C13|nr:FAD-dependent oxidoreductase [Brevibacillus daliensis]